MNTLQMDRISKQYGGKIILDNFSKIFYSLMPHGLSREPAGSGVSKVDPRAPLWSPSVHSSRAGEIQLGKKYPAAYCGDFYSGFYALVGKNGSGKSTILSLLAGAEIPDKGQIILSNVNLKNNPYNYKKLISYVPDKTLFYPNSKAYEFLNYIISVKKVPNTDLSRLRNMLQRFGIANFLDQKIKNLSLGTQKKLFLSTIMISNPLLILLDEPTNGLDKEAENVLIGELKQMKEKIIIFSTHQEKLLKELSAEIINLDSKREINLAYPSALSCEDAYLN